MKVLFIGGSGVISTACSNRVLQRNYELTLVNRSLSKKGEIEPGARVFVCDVHKDPAKLKEILGDEQFDVVVDWVAFTPEHVERDIRLFSGRTKQFFFISSASVYQKPPKNYIITEDTPIENPYWRYAQDKIACEKRLMKEYNERGFPVTIIRPSHTYGVSQIPMIHGSWDFPWTMVDRIKRGEPVIVPGDGTSLWTLTWNEDFARALVGLFGRMDAVGEAFHITSDEVLTWNQIFEELGQALGIRPRIVHIPSELIAMYNERATGSLIGDKANSIVFDNSKIKRFVPGFQCETSWAQGVRRALEWFEADPQRQRIDSRANELWDRIINAYERAYPRNN